MEMKVDRQLIRSRRLNRAWSQEHLANVSGLGLRTVQRIEAAGLASYESAKAIAAVLEMPVGDLVERTICPDTLIDSRRSWRRAAAVAGSLATATGIFFASGAFADDVMLAIGLQHNDEPRSTSRLLTAEGDDAEIRVEGILKLVIVPTIQADGQIRLATKLYESEGDQFVLRSEPQITTGNDHEAEIRIALNDGNSLKVIITPTIQ